jgi:hypothetical protein
MNSTPEFSKRTGTMGRPAVRALSLLVIAALQMPGPSAAERVGDRLARSGAADGDMHTVFAKATLTPDAKYRGNCVDCHGRDLEGVIGKQALASSDRAIRHGNEKVDAGPNEILLIAGGVSSTAVVGLLLLGFFGSRAQIHSTDEGQSRYGNDRVDV